MTSSLHFNPFDASQDLGVATVDYYALVAVNADYQAVPFYASLLELGKFTDSLPGSILQISCGVSISRTTTGYLITNGRFIVGYSVEEFQQTISQMIRTATVLLRR